MEVEWRADTSKIALCKRAASTLLLARRIHKKVQALERELEDDSDLDDDEKEEQWEQVHRSNARDVYNHIIKYKGFLAKVGQFVSAKGGGVPEAYKEQFRPLQDHLPVSPADEVRRTLQSELGRKPEETFKDFQQRPLASATVAQAHLAYVRSTGQKVCIKVQHAGAGQMMSVDLTCVEYIARKAIKSHKEAPDFTPLIKEWKRAARDEVDFTLEARLSKRAGQALKKHCVDVKCPVPVDDLCTKRVLTMEFIDGWKVTDTEKMPKGTDVSAFAKKLIDAFAVLVFEEGLIHGDPHPGNIFAEPLEDGTVRPVLLDWGIAKEMTKEERFHCARWVAASMSQDRVMFMSAVKALGFQVTQHFESEALEGWMLGSLFMFRDSLPGSADSYLFGMMDQLGEDEKEEGRKLAKEKEEKKKHTQDGKKRFCCSCTTKKKKKKKEPKKPVENIPGVVLFFTRALGLLQGLCSTLNVAVPFAEPMLRRSMPLLIGGHIPRPISEAAKSSTKLEAALLAKLRELQGSGCLVGAQIAVHSVSKTPGDAWLCNLAFGHMGLSQAPVTDSTLMPLLDVGIGVLAICFLVALAGPSSTGKRFGLDSPVSEIWPEFGQRGKRGVTIRQLLQQKAALSAPFQAQKMSLKRFCTEKHLEESIAAAPQEEDAASAQCPVLGVAIAALLRKLTGSHTTVQSLKGVLELLGLTQDIAWQSEEERMAWVVRKPIEDLPLFRVFQWVEGKRDKLQIASHAKLKEDQSSKWLTWKELDTEHPSCTDPLLPNRPEMRAGEMSVSGRGLRATAKAVCELYSSSASLPMLLNNIKDEHRLRVDSLEEWERSSRCLDMGVGCQLFRFKRVNDASGDAEDTKDIVGYGYADSDTGSVALHLPGTQGWPPVSVAVLLNNVAAINQDTHYAGFELLTIIAAHFELEPIWHKQVPEVPAKAPPRRSKTAEKDEKQELRASLARMEERLAQMSSDLQLLQSGNSSNPHTLGADAAASQELLGTWKSAEIEGLEKILEIFEVPQAFHFFAKQAVRTLCIQAQGAQLSVSTSITLAGQTVEETVLSFKPDGSTFHGEQKLGGSFRGVAKWETCDSADSKSLAALVLEKRFMVNGRELVVEERMTPCADGRLTVAIKCDGLSQVGISKHNGPIESTMYFDRQGEKPATLLGTASPCKSTDAQSISEITLHEQMIKSKDSTPSCLSRCYLVCL